MKSHISSLAIIIAVCGMICGCGEATKDRRQPISINGNSEKKSDYTTNGNKADARTSNNRTHVFTWEVKNHTGYWHGKVYIWKNGQSEWGGKFTSQGQNDSDLKLIKYDGEKIEFFRVSDDQLFKGIIIENRVSGTFSWRGGTYNWNGLVLE